jgi:AcrR family transcriptional regulator
MPRSPAATRTRILDAAYERFYRLGFARVALNDIANAAGVTKRTLYYHFRSKDDLLAATLEAHHQLSLERIRKWGNRAEGNVRVALDGIFAELARWSDKPGWVGPGFTRMAVELADLPGHPARAIARRHKAAVETWYIEFLGKAGVRRAAERGRELAMLVEGASLMILIHGDRSYAEAAARAARRLINNHSQA